MGGVLTWQCFPWVPMGGFLAWQCFPWGGAHRAGVGEGPGGISLTAGFTLEGDVVGASTAEVS